MSDAGSRVGFGTADRREALIGVRTLDEFVRRALGIEINDCEVRNG